MMDFSYVFHSECPFKGELGVGKGLRFSSGFLGEGKSEFRNRFLN